MGGKCFTGMWHRSVQMKDAGTGLKQAGPLPCQVFLLYFLGQLLGSQWKRPLRGARGSAEGDTGAVSCSAKGTQGLFPPAQKGTQGLFPPAQKCISKSGGQGVQQCVLPAWGPEGAADLGRFPGDCSALCCGCCRLAGLHS